MSPVERASVNTHPLKVPNLVTKFGKQPYTIRKWSKNGKLPGARRIGRDWCYPLDVEYVEEPKAVAVEEQVNAALKALREYQVGKPRIG